MASRRGSFLFVSFSIALGLGTAACGATLTRGPGGWHESRLTYSVAPLEGGALFPAGWKIEGYAQKEDGFRRETDKWNAPDLELHRVEDDGILMVAGYTLKEEDLPKRAEVLADRWLDKVVQNPKEGDEDVEMFASVAPFIKKTATGSVGLYSTSATVVSGHQVQTDRREPFTVPGGEGAELLTTLSPAGSSPDRRLYVAVIKQTNGEHYVVVAYGNTPPMFDKGVADATSFARRVHF
jgi:hypothetical protein